MFIRKSRTWRALALSLAAGSGLLSSREALGLTFNLTPASGMDPQAIAGFNAATARWSTLISTNVPLYVNINFTGLGAGVLGSTQTTRFATSYNIVKSAFNTHINSADDTSAYGALQSASTVKMLLNKTANNPNGSGSLTPYFDNDGDTNNTNLFISSANGRALGLYSTAITTADAAISFNNDPSLTWDFDPSNGITPGALDFVGIAQHEIGHALGFISGTDILDTSATPQDDNIWAQASTMDLFRFSTQSIGAGGGVGVIDYAVDTRDKYFSIDGGTTKLASFSTGVVNGDGRQASHWKEGAPPTGLLDPTAANGEMLINTARDLQLLDVIGWAISPTATSTWNAAAGGSFSDSSKWASSNTPSLAKSAVFNLAATYTVSVTGTVNAASTSIRSGNVTFNTSAGSLVTGTFNVAPNSGETASATVSGGTLWANYITIGRVGGGSTASLNLAGGVNVTTVGGIGLYPGGSLALTSATLSGGPLSLQGGALILTGANSIGALSASTTPLDVGAGSLTVNGTFTTAASATVTKAGAGVLTIAGAQSHGANSTLVNPVGTLNLNTNAGSASTANLQLNSSATTNLNASQNLRGLSVTGGVTTLAHTSSGPTKSIKSKSLAISGGGALDLTNNRLVVDYTGTSELGTWSSGSYTKILGLLQSGRNGGSWDGPGIITSETQAGDSQEYTMLAVGEASQILGISGTQVVAWGDQTVDATSVLIKYTYAGDANLDGALDIDDYSQLDLGDLQNLRGYTNGDFNYDGSVDVDDYGMIDFTLQIQGGPIGAAEGAGPVGLSVSAVPEPASIGLLLVGASTLLGRRRRR